MKGPVIEGLIRRRILVNYRVDPDVIQRILPVRFRPKLYNGHAIAGICAIRLEAIRPKGMPRLFGISSENAAHRIAVLWDSEDGPREGVFIPRRDTGSRLNNLVGGRLFPGEHHLARFSITETHERLSLSMSSNDGKVTLQLEGRFGGALPLTSAFPSLEEASRFFEPGSLGYSVTRRPGRLDGITLQTHGWQMEPMQVEEVSSSFFNDDTVFPASSTAFDCALAMRNLQHEWHTASDLYS